MIIYNLPSFKTQPLEEHLLKCSVFLLSVRTTWSSSDQLSHQVTLFYSKLKGRNENIKHLKN